MFGPGGGGAYGVRSGEDLLCEGPDWMAACGGLGKELRASYLDSVALLAARIARRDGVSRKLLAPIFEDEVYRRVAALGAEVGEFPGWWPERLPHVRIELRESRAPDAGSERIYADPNRRGLGADLACRRIWLWLLGLPVPYSGRVNVEIVGPDGGRRLGGLEMWFEVATTGQPGDPGVREALVASERQALRAHREHMGLMKMTTRKDLEFSRMFGRSKGVIGASADVHRARGGADNPGHQPAVPGFSHQAAQFALAFMRQLTVELGGTGSSKMIGGLSDIDAPAEDDHDETCVEDGYDDAYVEDDYDETYVETDYDDAYVEDDYDETYVEDDCFDADIEDEHIEEYRDHPNEAVGADDYGWLTQPFWEE